jgi:ABC-type transport system involved in cytochrome bd biosynthesis fused ATPase/permease subunit
VRLLRANLLSVLWLAFMAVVTVAVVVVEAGAR